MESKERDNKIGTKVTSDTTHGTQNHFIHLELRAMLSGE
jgi:hypothetical protein